VAYFTQSKPVKGSSTFSYQWMNSTWWFASAEDRDEFVGNPEKYAPPYGGYCAYGVSQGHTAPIDPEAWTIIEVKLYLNYSKGVKNTWSGAIPKHIDEANRNWPGLHK
jgi:YHS domain-containing protein